MMGDNHHARLMSLKMRIFSLGLLAAWLDKLSISLHKVYLEKAKKQRGLIVGVRIFGSLPP
jgi:hypothetical protein